MNARRWMILFLIVLLVPFVFVGSMVFVIDPYFHYRKPSDHFFYELKYERYINPGILRHFDYDGLIIGTSMCQNFKTSEFDDLYGVQSVKTCAMGASYAEIRLLEEIALESNPNLKTVVRGLDYNKLDWGEHELETDNLPMYLYNEDPLDDVQYLLNRETLINMRSTFVEMLRHPGSGGITSFDDYENWMAGVPFGIEAVRNSITGGSSDPNAEEFTDDQIDATFTMDVSENKDVTFEDIERVKANIRRNVVDPAKSRPDVMFYCFFTPYSIFYWDDLIKNGSLERQIEMEKAAIEEILSCDNIRLYSFNLEKEIVEDLDNYKDSGHYGEWINSEILEKMLVDDNLLTEENYEEYLEDEMAYYEDYDYGWLWEDISGRKNIDKKNI